MKTILAVTLLFLTQISFAITCEKMISGDNVKVTISSSDIEIFVNDKLEKVIPARTTNNGYTSYSLTIGEGIAIKHSNHYGCIRQVKMISSIDILPLRHGTVNFGTCRGGSTSDELCLRY